MSAKHNKRFLPVHPIGIGTADVESPQSLLKRLEQRNCASISEILNFQLKKLGLDLPRQPSGHLQISSARKICAGNKYSDEIIQCLADACRLPEDQLSLLTLRRFRHIFHNGLSRNEFHCNPTQFAREAQNNWYEKLIWNIDGIHFDTDGRALTSECPHCRKKLKPFLWTSKIGKCSHLKCGQIIDGYLLPTDNTTGPINNWSRIEYAQWATEKTGELLKIGKEAEGFDFYTSFRHFYTHAGFRNFNAAEKKLNINHVTISNWLKGKGRVTYEIFLGLLFAFDISPFDFFAQRRLDIPMGCCPRLAPSPYMQTNKEIKRRSSINRIQVREKIKEDLSSDKYISVAFSAYLKKRFNHPVGSLYHFTTDLGKIHKAKRQTYIDAQAYIKRAKEIAEFEECFRLCKERGISFSRRNVAKLIDQPGKMMNNSITKLMREIRLGRHKVPSRQPCFAETLKN